MNEGFTQEALKRLESAIAQGTLKVSYGDKFVVYRSLDEMLEIRNFMKRRLAQTLPATAGIVMKFNKGFNKGFDQ
jgi:hypothetical protein